jgi:hypothetical protein
MKAMREAQAVMWGVVEKSHAGAAVAAIDKNRFKSSLYL